MSRPELSESEFERLAAQTLARIEAAVESASDAAGLDLDLQMKPGGVLELGFEDGSKMIINRQGAARELWVAARSGGFHFFHDGNHWVDTRDGGELFAALGRLIREQGGEDLQLSPH